MRNTTWGDRRGTSARRQLAQLLSLVMLVAAMAAVSPAPASAAGATRVSGYNTSAGWVGAYKVRGQKAYRIRTDRAVFGAYKPAVRSARTPARARAAWILSKYGGRGTRIQAAGVDTAVLHLLAGRSFRLEGRKGRARLAGISGGDRRYVVSYARQMLKASRGQLGPYSTALGVGAPVPAGSATRLTFTLRSSSGNGIFGVPVNFTYADGGRRTAYTNKAGVASVVVDAAAGQQRARATAVGLPDWRLSISKPRRARAAKVVLAGRTRKVSASAVVTGTTAQTVTIRNANSTVQAGEAMSGSYTIDGGSGDRTVRIAIYGPGSGVNIGCDGTPRRSWTSTTTGSTGVAALPSFTSTASGYYRWLVQIDANESSPAASSCGRPVRLQRRATISQQRPEALGRTVRAGRDFGVEVRIGGFDRAEDHQVWTRTYGPFNTAESARCTDARQIRRVTRTVAGNGTYAMTRMVATRTDVGRFFAFSSTLSTGNLILGNNSACGIVFEVVK